MAKAGRGSDQFQIRLPEGLRDRIKAHAERQGRSMNAEIVAALEEKYPPPQETAITLVEFEFMLDQYLKKNGASKDIEKLKSELKKIEEISKDFLDKGILPGETKMLLRSSDAGGLEFGGFVTEVPD